MNRKIKFRGKRLDNGEWEYGDLWQHNGRVDIIDRWANSHPVDPETVGQYTGLKDKRGVAIYEGDILKVPDLYELRENTSMTYHNEIIHFKNFTFTLGDDPLGEDFEYVSEECEVIGNIYENPELLEGEGA